LLFFDKFGIILSDTEKFSQKLWHAISGAAYVENELGINDKEIVSAIRYHTTAKENMTLLEKIVYIADFTSEDRKYSDVDVVREMVDESLEKAIVYALKYTICDLTKKNMPIHEDTLKAYNYLLIQEA
jgi:nicotinate-nucleotide adenylyltransferase